MISVQKSVCYNILQESKTLNGNALLCMGITFLEKRSIVFILYYQETPD